MSLAGSADVPSVTILHNRPSRHTRSILPREHARVAGFEGLFGPGAPGGHGGGGGGGGEAGRAAGFGPPRKAVRGVIVGGRVVQRVCTVVGL